MWSVITWQHHNHLPMDSQRKWSLSSLLSWAKEATTRKWYSATLIWRHLMGTRMTTILFLFAVGYGFKSVIYAMKYAHSFSVLCFVVVLWVSHDDVIKWKHFLRYWLFARGIHRPPMRSHYLKRYGLVHWRIYASLCPKSLFWCFLYLCQMM